MYTPYMGVIIKDPVPVGGSDGDFNTSSLAWQGYNPVLNIKVFRTFWASVETCRVSGASQLRESAPSCLAPLTQSKPSPGEGRTGAGFRQRATGLNPLGGGSQQSQARLLAQSHLKSSHWLSTAQVKSSLPAAIAQERRDVKVLSVESARLELAGSWAARLRGRC